ncbi:MAG: hypothetical protein IPK44_02530 [Candidatus Accumulibacter sp.]|uniref:hypothetical protein n=1 Tax=Accumulibacter sp. TaxID=2053492 RepID=UPI002585F190|nr:hypothetical protein [Accumulibacter sp.]MBK8113478.1 hypothetical protein [Accumulibacter sp.]
MKTPAYVLKQGTDYAAGWETGRNKGRERLCGKRLVDRLPPEHIRLTTRADEWYRGYKAGLLDRKQAALSLVCYRTEAATSSPSTRPARVAQSSMHWRCSGLLAT